MANNSKKPVLPKDPVHKLVDIGLPLERFNNANTYLQFYKEKQFLSRTSDYKPIPIPVAPVVQKYVRNLSCIKGISADFKDFNSKDCVQFVMDSLSKTREFDLADPLKGNSLASAQYSNSTLYLFSAGNSLTQLVVSLTSSDPFEIRPDYKIQLPLDTLEVIETIDLKYPIRQISFSPLDTKVFLVRTTSSIHVFSLDEDRVLKHHHRLFLADETEINSDIDYSMPIHVELSPYNLYQYLFITNNGYISIRDASNGKVIFENIDPFLEDLNYSSRWKSCGFGTTPSTLYIASPNRIALWDIKDDFIKTKTLATSNTPITAFTTSKSRSLYCFATLKSLVIFDILIPNKPVITYKHRFTRGAPSLISIENLHDNNWRIHLFSHTSQQLSILDFEYINSPSKSIARKLTVKAFHHFSLPENAFEDISESTDIITSMGFSLTTLDKDENKEFISIERLFEDGSMRVKYVEMTIEKPKEELELITQPQYNIIPDPGFKAILEDAIIFALPRLQFRKIRTIAELRNINTVDFTKYLEDISTRTATNKLTDEVKTSVASKVRQLKYPTTFGELFDRDSYLTYDLNELDTFLHQLEQYEDIEIIKQLNIPSLVKNTKSTDPELTQQLDSAHEKRIQLFSAIIRPLPEKYEPKHSLQYLTNEDLTYESTTTTKVLAHYWPINHTSYRDLVFPQLDTTIVAPTETFPSVSSSRKRQASDFGLPSITIEEDLSLPTILETAPVRRKAPKISSQQSQEYLEPPSPARSFTAVSTQPLPGAFGSRTKSVSKKKKKPKASGFK